MFQQCIGDSSCHKGRNGIADQGILWYFFLSVIASCLTLSLKHKDYLQVMKEKVITFVQFFSASGKAK